MIQRIDFTGIKARARFVATGIILGSFMLQSVIPIGYMPASITSGSFVELCPKGVSAAWMMTYLGHDHAHHKPDKSNFLQCDLSGGLASASIASQSQISISFSAAAIEVSRFDSVLFAAPALLRQRARAPPSHSRFIEDHLKLI